MRTQHNRAKTPDTILCERPHGQGMFPHLFSPTILATSLAVFQVVDYHRSRQPLDKTCLNFIILEIDNTSSHLHYIHLTHMANAH